MSTGTPTVRPSPRARAEAAAWIARLHGPNRTAEVEAGFRRWMGEDPERAVAVGLINDTWEKSARLRRRPLEGSTRLSGFRISFSLAALATVATAILAVVGTVFFLRTNTLRTEVGELRTLALEDGTRVYLNTDTRVVPHYDGTVRRVDVERGEALFEVAQNPHRPFIVIVGDHQIRALGTSFVVRRDKADVAVTLVEGKVSITPTADGRAREAANRDPKPGAVALILEPGERATLKIAGPVREPSAEQPYAIDKPSIDRVTAWRHGQVAFDDTALADAVAEMNRYSRIRVVVEDQGTAALRISGIFRAGDQENFARAVAKTYRLDVSAHEQDIVLAGRVIRAE